jgi:methylated-DNA-[protein]-cysteine S-methyltransferase
MKTLNYIHTKTPVGQFYMILDNDGVIASGFNRIEAIKKHLPVGLIGLDLKDLGSNHPFIPLIQAYFKGDLTSLDKIPHRQSGTPFYTEVWRKMSQIRPGQTLSYLDLAKKVGRAKAVRSVGSACGKNRLCLIVPCHRVIKSDGSIGQYAYGDKIKSFLLNFERSN